MGRQWGEALARFAVQHPVRPDDNSERPFLSEIGVALWARIAHYDAHKARLGLDPNTFRLVDVVDQSSGKD
jgi:hypothetical protein